MGIGLDEPNRLIGSLYTAVTDLDGVNYHGLIFVKYHYVDTVDFLDAQLPNV